jgi:hypothetical protein
LYKNKNKNKKGNRIGDAMIVQHIREDHKRAVMQVEHKFATDGNTY